MSISSKQTKQLQQLHQLLNKWLTIAQAHNIQDLDNQWQHQYQNYLALLKTTAHSIQKATAPTTEEPRKLEKEFGDDDTPKTTLTVDVDNKILAVSHEDEENQTAFVAQLSKAGIELGGKKTFEAEIDDKTVKVGIISIKPIFDFSAELEIDSKLTSNASQVGAKLAIAVTIGLEFGVDVLVVTLSLIGELNYSGSAAASLYIGADQKGVLKIAPSTHQMDLAVSFGVKPVGAILKVIEAVHGLLEEAGIADQEFDEGNYQWIVPIAKGTVMDITLPASELSFEASSFPLATNLPDLIQQICQDLDSGFLGTLIDIAEWIVGVIEFIDGILSDIGAFFEKIWDGLLEGLEELFSSIGDLFKSDEELARERLQEFLENEGKRALEIIFKRGVELIKNQPKHLKALRDLGNDEDKKNTYIQEKVWPAVKKDAFIRQSFKAMNQKDYNLLDKNKKIAETAFFIQDYNFDGVKNGNAFVVGTHIDVTLNLAIDGANLENLFSWMDKLLEDWENTAKGRKEGVKVDGQIILSLYCDGEEVDAAFINIDQMMHAKSMSTVYTGKLQIYDDDLPASPKGKWSIGWKIDFVGQIMDIHAEPVAIEVTYKQPEEPIDRSVLEPQVSEVVYAQVGKLSVRKTTTKVDQNGQAAYLQGRSIDLNIPVQLNLIPEDKDKVRGVVFSKLYYNQKVVAKSKKTPFSILQRHVDKGHRNVISTLSIPQNDNYLDTALGGKWQVYTYVKIEGISGTESRNKTIRVFNANKQFTAPEASQSMASSEDLEDNKNSSYAPDEDEENNMSTE